jgi:dTDP-4-dehydrorhamnose reductase
MLGREHQVQALSRLTADVTDFDSLGRAFDEFGPDWVINTAAYHKVDVCEQNPDIASEVNDKGALNVALATKAVGARSVYISTDYVFSGDADFSEKYSESDSPNPINVYGKTKLRGEFRTLEVDSSNIVARISSVFGSAGSSGKGGNFVEAIIGKLRIGETPKVVNDTRMSPTYTVTAVRGIESLVNLSGSGVFHLNNSGSISWFEFASRIADRLGYSDGVEPTYSNPDVQAARPRNSAMDNAKVSRIISLGSWAEALDSYLMEKGYL